MDPIRYVPEPNFIIVCNPKLKLDFHAQIALIKQIFNEFYDKQCDASAE